MGFIKMYCWKCKNEIIKESAVTRQETCPFCQAFLHCCLNCSFYDKFAHNECKEPQAEWVNEKDMGNFCEYFSPSHKKPAVSKTISKEEASKKIAELLKKNAAKN